MMAFVVILGLGDSKLAGLGTTDGCSTTHLELYQSKRAEQKAPRDLNNAWMVAKPLTLRGLLCGSRPLRALIHRPCAFVVVPSWSNSFSLQTRSCESSRAPPLMDPPSFA
jgi:hypothetical protein